MAGLEFQKWRHDVHSMINQFDNFDVLIASVLRKGNGRPKSLYENVLNLVEQSQAQGTTAP